MDRDLRAHCVVIYKHSGGPNGRRFPVSYVTIQRSGQVIARATLGGSYTTADALREYRRLPQRFHPAAKAR